MPKFINKPNALGLIAAVTMSGAPAAEAKPAPTRLGNQPYQNVKWNKPHQRKHKAISQRLGKLGVERLPLPKPVQAPEQPKVVNGAAKLTPSEGLSQDEKIARAVQEFYNPDPNVRKIRLKDGMAQYFSPGKAPTITMYRPALKIYDNCSGAIMGAVKNEKGEAVFTAIPVNNFADPNEISFASSPDSYQPKQPLEFEEWSGAPGEPQTDSSGEYQAFYKQNNTIFGATYSDPNGRSDHKPGFTQIGVCTQTEMHFESRMATTFSSNISVD